MRTIFRYIAPKKGLIGLCLFIKMGGTIIELVLPWMLSVILDHFVPARDMNSIVLWGILMVVVSALALAANVCANRLATRVTRDIIRALRGDLFARVLGLSRAQEDAFTNSSLISRLTSDTYNVYQLIDRMQRLGVRAPILLVGGLMVTFSMEPVLTLALLVSIPLLAVVVVLVSRAGIKMYAKSQQSLDGLVRRAKESMAGIRVIQALSKTGYETQKFDELNGEVAKRESRASMLVNITNPVMNALLNVGLTAVIVIGAYRVNAGDTQPGVIIAFLSYFTIILTALMMVSRLFVMISKGVASGRRVAEVLDTPADLQTLSLPARPDEAHVRFEGVSFSYNKAEKNLEDISFALGRGQTLGIIGPTGSGKTTLVNLLMRFYNADAGRISIGGQDVRAIPPEVLHTLFGVVFQNDFLLADTLLENIRFGRDLGLRQVEHAARIAQMDFVQGREEGFAYPLAPKGANLSGGQKQRVLIARALAADPSILVLDDSSSALDYKTDACLRRALEQHFAHTTKIIVAQRVSAIRHANHILVLEEGRIIGSGTHGALMETCESYREIAKIQMAEVE